MGYDLIAYFDIDQSEIEQFIKDNNIDRDSYDDGKQISEFYKKSIYQKR